MRSIITKNIDNPILFKAQLLIWSQSFREVVFLDSNAHNQLYSNYDVVLAVDAFTSLKTDYYNGFDDLKQYQQSTRDWLFGYLTYDLKNDTEKLNSVNYDGLHFPDLYFFQPQKIFLLKGNSLEMQYLKMCDDEINFDLNDILNVNLENEPTVSDNKIDIKQRISKENYLFKVNKMLQKIQAGDIYEANFCMEFYAENASINPLEKFKRLNTISKAPFSVFFKNNKHYLLCASPERYIQKKENKVISQPIKGTSKRYKDAVDDQVAISDLQNNPKERSENIMIVDLVRNDLSKTALKGSVNVEELCQIYTFEQVHQMISTIASEVSQTTSPIDILKSTFPMGSMTGAPKISAMKIIEDLEETKRGLYSGTVGYFTPSGDFDFNVVIRSILYNEHNNYLSFSVGSAITALAIPEAEYDECLLKAKAMHEVLN